jgi:hypothetical protein
VKTVVFMRSTKLQEPKRIYATDGRVYAGAPVIA